MWALIRGLYTTQNNSLHSAEYIPKQLLYTWKKLTAFFKFGLLYSILAASTSVNDN